MTKLFIDVREQKIKKLFETTTLHNIPEINYECVALDLGDFIIKNNDNIILIIERKSINDLRASIKDGRHKEQKARLLSNYPLSKIMYIIEGHIDPIIHDENIIYGAMLNTQFRDSLMIVRTFNTIETHKYLCYLYKKVINKPEFFSSIISDESNGGSQVPYEQTIKLKKKDNMTPELCQLLQLAQIPGISVNISKVIFAKYGSLKKLILEFDTHGEDMLSDIEMETTTGKKRRLGKVISSKVHTYLIN